MLDDSASAAGYTGTPVHADDAWLLGQRVNHWAGPRSLPLWLPADADGFSRRNNTGYRQAGGPLCPLGETIDAVLADERARWLERERRSGLTRTEELELITGLGH